MVARTPVILTWAPSSYSGWGVYGLNLFLEWADDPDWLPLTAMNFSRDWIVLDGLRRRRIEPFLQESLRLQNDVMSPNAGREVVTSGPVLHAIGNRFSAARPPQGALLRGRPNIGIMFFEHTSLGPAAVDAARAYSLIVTGSRWNEEVLRSAGVANVRTLLQGIDAGLFLAGPRAGWYRDRFVVFSGGKLEPRKGQDLVLRAFRAFAQRHPESLLVTAWQSPFPQFARALGAPLAPNGGVDVKGWAVANGLAAEQIIDLGPTTNSLMPPVLREADVALFTNRAEGGTNLVAMEAMACGVPCVLSRNTGHRDIMTAPGDPEPNCYPLERQSAVPDVDGGGTDGWGESDVEEAVEALEAVWRDRAEAATRAARGAATMAGLSWTAQARQLKEVIVNL